MANDYINFNGDNYEIYQSVDGSGELLTDTWYVFSGKKYAMSIYSDKMSNGSGDEVYLEPSNLTENKINNFSSLDNISLENTKINSENGEENVSLNLDKRIATFILDQSGSMSWNDSSGVRYDIAKKTIENIENNYPGDVGYNLIKFGADYINSLFFAVADDDFDPSNVKSLSSMYEADSNEYYNGVRVIRNDERVPSSPIDGDIVSEGYFSSILDEDLDSSKSYNYGIYTYDKNLKLSSGKFITVSPKERDLPRGISIFRGFNYKNDEGIKSTSSMVGVGCSKDKSSIGIWHMNEGEGVNLFDFSNNGIKLQSSGSLAWLSSKLVPCGMFGLDLNGENNSIFYNDNSGNLSLENSSFTIASWILPKSLESEQTLVSRSDGLNIDYCLSFLNDGTIRCYIGDQIFESSSLKLDFGKWQFVVCSYNFEEKVVKFYINNLSEESLSDNPSINPSYNISSSIFNIGKFDDNIFKSKICELAIYNECKDDDFVLKNLVEEPIYDEDGEEIGLEYSGLKDDNGDRINVFQFIVPSDYNFSGGEVVITRNDKNIPSWYSDGVEIYREVASSGIHYVQDSYDFPVGEKYYYRIFSRKNNGAYSDYGDSGELTVNIPDCKNSSLFFDKESFDPPTFPSYGNYIVPGDGKVYLRWGQDISSVNNKMSRVKIFYSYINYPIVNELGIPDNNSKLIYSGTIDDRSFVHYGVRNDKTVYYTIVNTDRVGRVSNYDDGGSQIYDFLHMKTTPSSYSDESLFPLKDIDNLRYSLIDDSSISLSWDIPLKSPSDINAYFDQTVHIYGFVSDIFGTAIPDGSLLKMYITSDIEKENQADNVFSGISAIDFQDIDAYSFFVNRTEDGYIHATLRMTDESQIISQIKSAKFKVQLKAVLSKGNYSLPNTSIESSDKISSLADYADLINQLTGEEQEALSQDNIFEYYSEEIEINFTNPWEVILYNRDEKHVYQRCYVRKEDKVTGNKFLDVVKEDFNGVYASSNNPFIVRAKLLYRGEYVESGGVDVAIWDADSSQLCKNASVDDSSSYEGERIRVSRTVTADNTFPVQVGEESYIGVNGEVLSRPFSYVDIPLFAPDTPQAVRVYVKGSRAGYSSVKDMYVLFQSTLQIDISANSPNVNGRDISEQIANVFIVDPNYPDYENSEYARSLITYPDDLSTVKWGIDSVESKIDRSIYSIDNVQQENGVFSYVRNGVARNVFLGPISKTTEEISEIHEISASIVYNGGTSTAKQYVEIDYNPSVYDKFNARFLMEIDGSWEGDAFSKEWVSYGWLSAVNNILWADGIDYIKVKICRNPKGSESENFKSVDCFRSCVAKNGSDVLVLDSFQVVKILLDDDSIEILHGEVDEVLDPYTGEYYLEVGENGFVENGTGYVSLIDKEESDITYFYIRASKFIPDSGKIIVSECNDEDSINECTCLSSNRVGLTECDLPRWDPVFYIRGETTLFFNNVPQTVYGGGDFYNGVPPCGVCLSEPLKSDVISRKITNYYYSEEFGDVSNNYIYPVTIDVDNNNFIQDDETLIKNDSKINVRVAFYWKGRELPENTPIYVSIGNNDGNSVFKSDSNVYYSKSNYSEGYSYVDVLIFPSSFPNRIITESVEVYSDYDERGNIDRHVGVIFNLTLDNSENNETFVEPLPDDEEISSESIPSIEEKSPFSNTVERYDLDDNSWDSLEKIPKKGGYSFGGIYGDYIYSIGGLKDGELGISNEIYKYSISENSWEEVGIMTRGRFGGISIQDENKIYLIGGLYNNKNNGNNLDVSFKTEVYDMDSGEFSFLSDLPLINENTFSEKRLSVALTNGILVSIGLKKYIYIFGGARNISYSSGELDVLEYNDRILRYSIDDDLWEHSYSLNSYELKYFERLFPSLIKIENNIHIFNGLSRDENNDIYPVESFSVEVTEDIDDISAIDMDLQYLDNNLKSRYQSMLVKSGEDISSDFSSYYIFGGVNSDSPTLDLIESIDVSGNEISYKSSYDGDFSEMSVPKYGALSFYDGVRYIYVIGGFSNLPSSSFVNIDFDI